MRQKKTTHGKVEDESMGFETNGSGILKNLNLNHINPRPPKKEGRIPAKRTIPQPNFQDDVELAREIIMRIEAQRAPVVTPISMNANLLIVKGCD